MLRKLRTGSDDTTTDRGREAERLAECFLVAAGLSIVARNFRVRGGEIDLICRDGAELVFVEVRLRQNGRFGGATQSITEHKQKRLVLAARHYLQKTGEQPCRFDCILLDRLDPAHITWLRAAFDADA